MNLGSTCLWLSRISPGAVTGIFPAKTHYNVASSFIDTIIAQSNSGTEFKGADHHAFAKTCRQHGTDQKLISINRPQTSGKAERGILTL
jgi:hypothetical protein